MTDKFKNVVKDHFSKNEPMQYIMSERVKYKNKVFVVDVFRNEIIDIVPVGYFYNIRLFSPWIKENILKEYFKNV